jgi:hypothetical protein
MAALQMLAIPAGTAVVCALICTSVASPSSARPSAIKFFVPLQWMPAFVRKWMLHAR